MLIVLRLRVCRKRQRSSCTSYTRVFCTTFSLLDLYWINTRWTVFVIWWNIENVRKTFICLTCSRTFSSDFTGTRWRGCVAPDVSNKTFYVGFNRTQHGPSLRVASNGRYRNVVRAKAYATINGNEKRSSGPKPADTRVQDVIIVRVITGTRASVFSGWFRSDSTVHAGRKHYWV